MNRRQKSKLSVAVHHEPTGTANSAGSSPASGALEEPKVPFYKAAFSSIADVFIRWTQEAIDPLNRRLILGLTAAILSAVPVGMATWFLVKAWNTKQYVLSTGLAGGGYDQVAGELLGKISGTSNGFVHLKRMPSAGAVENTERLGTNRAQFGFSQGGIKKLDGLYCVASLYNSYLYVFSRHDLRLGRISEAFNLLRRGQIRMSMGKEGSGSFLVMKQIAAYYGFDEHKLAALRNQLDVSSSFDQATAKMLKGEGAPDHLDVCCVLLKSTATALTRFADDRFDLLAVDDADAVNWRNSELHPCVIPAGAVIGSPRFPVAPTTSLFVKEYLVCNGKVRDKDVYSILEALDLISADLPNLHEFDRSQPEKEFIYPLHSGAREFYLRNPKPLLRNLVTTPALFGLMTNVTLLIGFSFLLVRRRRIKPLLTEAAAAYRFGMLSSKTEEIQMARSRLLGFEVNASDLYADLLINDDERRRCVEYIRARRQKLHERMVTLGHSEADIPVDHAEVI